MLPCLLMTCKGLLHWFELPTLAGSAAIKSCTI